MNIIDHFRNERFFSYSIVFDIFLFCRKERERIYNFQDNLHTNSVFFLDFHFFFSSSFRLIRLFQWYHQKIPLKSPTTSRWFDLISSTYVVWISSRGLLSVVSIILCFSRFFFISLLIHHWRDGRHCRFLSYFSLFSFVFLFFLSLSRIFNVQLKTKRNLSKR